MNWALFQVGTSNLATIAHTFGVYSSQCVCVCRLTVWWTILNFDDLKMEVSLWIIISIYLIPSFFFFTSMAFKHFSSSFFFVQISIWQKCLSVRVPLFNQHNQLKSLSLCYFFLFFIFIELCSLCALKFFFWTHAIKVNVSII